MTLTQRFSLVTCGSRIVALYAVLLIPAASWSDAVISVSSATVTAGSNGNTIEVDLANTGPSAVNIGSFSFGVSVGTNDFTFTNITTATAIAPYIFSGQSLFGPDITNNAGPQFIEAFDISSVPGSGTTVGAGATVGLGD